MSALVEVLAYRPGVKGTRIGFVDLVILSVGLEIRDCILHRAPTSGAPWIQVPARTLQDGDGRPVAGFRSGEARRRFADAVVRQIAEKFGGCAMPLLPEAAPRRIPMEKASAVYTMHRFGGAP